jgi:chorismate dehydratase
VSSAGSALSGLRIGPVSYLNAKPLIWSLDSSLLQTDVPSALSEQFFAEKLDIALLPVVDILRAGRASIVDNVGIACDGEVFSVVVASRTSFAETGKIHLDPASRSSTALLRILLAEFYPRGPEIAEGEEIPADGARLLIGDSAIAFRRRKGSTWQYHDLGALWKFHTGLPFVFALWAVANGASPAVFDALRDIKAAGLAARSEIAAREPDSNFAYTYLTKHIRYDIGSDEKAALRHFEMLAKRHGILADTPPAKLDFR